MCRTDDCLEIFLKRHFLLAGGDKGGGERKSLGFSLKLVAPSLPSQCQQDQTPLDTPVWQSQSILPRYGTPWDKCHFIPPWFYPPVLAVPFPALLTPPRHPRLGAVFPSGTDFNGGVLQGGGPQGHFIPALRGGK